MTRSLLADRWTISVCVSRVFLFATFMTVASVVPILERDWGIGAARAGAIITVFGLAYGLSLFLFSWAADHVGAKRAVLVSAIASAAAAGAFGVFARDWVTCLVLYGLIGLAQGGVYTPIVMLVAERSTPARRGTAMGWLIASTSVGYAVSLLLSGVALGFGGYKTVFLLTGFLPSLGAAMLVLSLARTENRVHARNVRVSISRAIFGSRDARLLTAGYTAHSWELLGSWAWLPSLIAASLALSGTGVTAASRSSAFSIAPMHLVGAAAALSMGALSDRLGRRAVLLGVAGAAAVLSLSIGWLVTLPVTALVVLGLAYSFLTIGDSPVLTTAITEVTDPGYMGMVLAVRSLLGFGAGALAPVAAGLVFDGANALSLRPSATWGATFAVLGLGGMIATICAAALTRRSPKRSGAAPSPHETLIGGG